MPFFYAFVAVALAWSAAVWFVYPLLKPKRELNTRLARGLQFAAYAAAVGFRCHRDKSHLGYRQPGPLDGSRHLAAIGVDRHICSRLVDWPASPVATTFVVHISDFLGIPEIRTGAANGLNPDTEI